MKEINRSKSKISFYIQSIYLLLFYRQEKKLRLCVNSDSNCWLQSVVNKIELPPREICEERKNKIIMKAKILSIRVTVSGWFDQSWLNGKEKKLTNNVNMNVKIPRGMKQIRVIK